MPTVDSNRVLHICIQLISQPGVQKKIRTFSMSHYLRFGKYCAYRFYVYETDFGRRSCFFINKTDIQHMHFECAIYNLYYLVITWPEVNYITVKYIRGSPIKYQDTVESTNDWVYRIFYLLGEPRIYRGTYMSAHVLLNLLNELRKRDKMRGLLGMLSLLRNRFNELNNTGAWILHYVYHMSI